MNNQPLRGSRSHHSLDLATEGLLWHRWAEMNSLSYLNLIDFHGKKIDTGTIPWFNNPYTDEEIWQYSQTTVYTAYEPYILDKISFSNKNSFKNLIEGILHVCSLYSRIFNSDRKTMLYFNLIQRLYEKRIYDLGTFLKLWNLCSNSDDAKINVLKSLLDKNCDKKSTVLLKYSLMIAQAAHFNFWGIWFNNPVANLSYFCPVTTALLKNDEDHLVILLEHGFEQVPHRVAIYDKYYNHLCNTMYSWLKAPMEERNLGRSAIITEVLLFLVRISKIKSKTKLRSLEKCFRLLWSTNTVPFVTESELRNEINIRFESPPRMLMYRCFPSTCNQFLNLVEYYDLVKPQGCTEDVVPRSLQQFCKCVIRKTLVRSYNLPKGIKKLPLPRKLQEFLDV